MKMFTIVIAFMMLSLTAFARGQSDHTDMESNEMMEESTTQAGAMMIAPVPYMDYMGMEDAMMLAESKPTVLFFYANWCPTCQATMKELNASPEKMRRINLLIVDYDNSRDLQQKFGITYQHTFVQIDTTGMAVKKWNGGGVDEILMNTEKEMM